MDSPVAKSKKLLLKTCILFLYCLITFKLMRQYSLRVVRLNPMPAYIHGMNENLFI